MEWVTDLICCQEPVFTRPWRPRRTLGAWEPWLGLSSSRVTRKSWSLGAVSTSPSTWDLIRPLEMVAMLDGIFPRSAKWMVKACTPPCVMMPLGRSWSGSRPSMAEAVASTLTWPRAMSPSSSSISSP